MMPCGCEGAICHHPGAQNCAMERLHDMRLEPIEQYQKCPQCGLPHDRTQLCDRWDCDKLKPAAHDPGGSKKFPLQPGVCGRAEFSGPGNCYSSVLERWWGRPDAAYLLSIGMNPSTAEAGIDDPTIRWELDLTRRLGFTRYVKVNVGDYRSTSPKGLLGVQACSDLNRVTIRSWAAGAHTILAAWGKLHPKLKILADNVLFDLHGREIWCVGKNADGSPKHPLYVPKDVELERYR